MVSTNASSSLHGVGDFPLTTSCKGSAITRVVSRQRGINKIQSKRLSKHGQIDSYPLLGAFLLEFERSFEISSYRSNCLDSS